VSKKDDLKAPDPFLKFTMELWDKLYAMRKVLGLLVLVIIVGAIGFAAITAHKNGLRSRAGAALGEALAVQQRPVKGDDDATVSADPNQTPFKTNAEKQQAIVSALEGVIAKYPGTEAATNALIPLASAQLALGKLDDAQRNDTAFLAAATRDPQFRALAQLGLANVAEAKKDWTTAGNAYATLQTSAPHAFLKDQAALGKARMLEKAGKKQEAAAAYAEVKDGFAGSPVAREATERLAFLATLGVHPPVRAAPQPPPSGAGTAPKAD